MEDKWGQKDPLTGLWNGVIAQVYNMFFIFFFVALGLFLFLCLPYLHWECFIRNTQNWHLTLSSLLPAYNLLSQA